MDELLTTGEAALIAKRHKWTITNWIRQGKLRASKASGQWRIRQADLEKLLFNGGKENGAG